VQMYAPLSLISRMPVPAGATPSQYSTTI
jgi:hypothetical protein